MPPDTHIIPAAHLARDIGARAVTAMGLLGIGLIHLLDAIGKYNETRYLFWMYIALILGCLAAVTAVLFSRSRGAFLAAAGLAAVAAVGYILSRSTGLPQATADIGNWTEPLGLASLFIEAAVVAIATSAYVFIGDGRSLSGAGHVVVPTAQAT